MAARFLKIPSVDDVSEADGRVTIRGVGDELVTDVIHCLSECRANVTEFRTVLPNLEDVFLKLTGRHIRE